MADNQEEGEHVEEEDKVIHTKKKVATKPVAADEEPDEEHESSDEKEQTDTRRSKRETSKQKTDNKLQAKGKPKTQEEPEREDSSEDDVPAKEPHKQVDVIASTTPHVVDVHPRSSVPPPPSSSPAPTPNSQPPPSTQPQKTRDDPLTSTPRPSSQPYPSKHTAPSQTPSKNKILPNKIPSQELGNLSLVVDISTLGDLSQYTDKDVESLLYPKVSIKDVHFLNEDEDVNADKLEDDSLLEEEKEEEELKRHKKRGRKTRDSPSSDEEEEEDAEDSVDKDSPSRSPSLEPLAEAAEPLARRSVSKSLLGEEPNPSFREVDTRGSSREMDKSGNDAVEDALAEDLAPIQLAATINKAMMDPDSDTAVASNGEDAVPDLPSPEKPASVIIVRQRSDSIEEPLEDGGRQPVDPIVSDDGVPVTRPTHRVEVVIRTRSQKKKEGQPSADMKKLSELPIPSPSMRIIKPSPTTTPLAPPVPARLTRARKGVVDKRARSSPVPRAEEADSEGETPTQTKTRSGRISKALIKSTKSATKPPSKAASTSASQTSLTTSTSKPVSTNDHTPAKPPPKTPEPKKANPLPKGTPLDPEKPVEEESGGQDPNDPASQWATLKESQIASQETPGQLDELISSNGSQKDPDEPASSPSKLFLPSETQPSFPYSQFADTPGSQPPPANKPSPNDSDDEDEVANSVIKPRAPRPQYRGLSSMAGSQFAMPKFKPENSGNSRRPKDDLYGMADKKDGSGSASDTDSDSDEEKPLASQSHIAPSRRAGAQTTKA